jgi:hypothetical protein
MAKEIKLQKFMRINKMQCPLCNENSLESGYYIGFFSAYMGYESHCKNCKNENTLYFLPILFSWAIFIPIFLITLFLSFIYLNPINEIQKGLIFISIIIFVTLLYHLFFLGLSKTKRFQDYIKNKIINDFKNKGHQTTDIDEIINRQYQQHKYNQQFKKSTKIRKKE